ncbi:hypothetical protein DY000_02011757 [Brassica cretica]|uniref:AT-hook motif nuclear-localized protein n=1 Tax=Brassica cretica TaxID=69181 RepID=A0ABQ7CY78_BRACR|nr:hypothetical protein DY000_02011757 [Brassica cretica]
MNNSSPAGSGTGPDIIDAKIVNINFVDPRSVPAAATSSRENQPSKAYTTGTRKRRKIQTECDNNIQGSGSSGETRWHKTGKTRPVMEEKEGELVVSKSFYQTKPRQCNWSSSTSSLNAIGGGGGEANSGGGGGEYHMRRDELGGFMAVAAGLPSYAMDQLSFVPFIKSFDEVCETKL